VQQHQQHVDHDDYEHVPKLVIYKLGYRKFEFTKLVVRYDVHVVEFDEHSYVQQQHMQYVRRNDDRIE
jgi:hypothetical protein